MNVFQKLKKVVVSAYEKHVQKRHEIVEVRKEEKKGWLQDPFFRRLVARAHRLARRDTMRIGPPLLTGARLQRVSKSCCPANLITQPRYRKESPGCVCGNHFTATPERVGELRYIGTDLSIKSDVAYVGLPA